MNTIRMHASQISPSKIICVGRNYVEHIAELHNEVPENMVVFVKPNSAIGSCLHAFHGGEPLHYECELCFLVENGQYAALGVGLDLTKRDLQSKLKNKGLPWERAKGFDGAALFSEFISIPADLELNELSFELLINGTPIQAGDPSLMMYKPQQILNEINTFMHMDDGDVIMTGTPKGVGLVQPGDQFLARLRYQGKIWIEKLWIAG